MLLVAAAGIALEGELVADEDPAGLPRLDVVAFLVDDPDDGAPRRPAVPGAARMSSGVAIEAQETSVEP